MTVVAFRDGIVAADTLVTRDYICIGYQHKIVRAEDGAILVMTGAAGEAQALRDWYLTGKIGPLPKFDDGWLLAVFPDHVDYYCEGVTSALAKAPFYAWGIGAEIAIGAMEAGASAELAVEITIKRHTHCGGKITVLKL